MITRSPFPTPSPLSTLDILPTEACKQAMPDIIDDTFVCGIDKCLDGPGGIIGFASSTFIYSWSGITAAGEMVFDTEDIPLLIDKWDDVILHEMGHIVGLNSGLFSGPLSLPNGTFSGTAATAVWRDEWGCEGFPPIETDFGSG